MSDCRFRHLAIPLCSLVILTPRAVSQEIDGQAVYPWQYHKLHSRVRLGPHAPLPGDVLYYVTALGHLPGGPEDAEPLAISELGQVTGKAVNAEGKIEAFLWDPVEGLIGLGDLPGGSFQSYGMGVNNLGHVAGFGNGALGIEAFLWTGEQGMIGLGDLAGWNHYSQGRGMNDLDQVVGMSHSDSGGGHGHATEAFLWDAEHGMVGLGDLPGGQFFSVAWDINNGTQVTGASVSSLGAPEGFIWDPENGMRPLEDTPPGVFAWTAKAINELGQITGQTNTGEAYLWDPRDGLMPLGLVHAGDRLSDGWDLNDVGQVVGRYKIDLDYGGAFIWDAEPGMRDLASLLAAGTDPDYTLLPHASGINNAGQIISHSVFKAVLLTPFVLGDMNCDELVDQDDIPALLLLLVDPDEYAQSYPDCPGEWAGDVNQDAVLDPADLYALRDFLGSAPSAQPGHYVPPEHISPMP